MTETQKFGVVVGSALWDYPLIADRRPQYGETVLCKTMRRSPGGKGLNQAVALAHLGAPVRFISAVGADPAGDELRKYCADRTLDPATIYCLSDHPTGLGVPIKVPNVGKFGFASPGASLALPHEAAAWFEDHLDSISWLLCHFETSKATLSEIVDLAHQMRIPIYMNAAPPNDEFLDFPFRANTIIANSSEAQWLSDRLSRQSHSPPCAETLRRLLNIDKVIVTAGSDGATWATAHESGALDAIRVEVVDPVGAGDAFCAGLVHALENRHQEIKSAAVFASICAAAAVSTLGAAEGMNSLSAIKPNAAKPSMR